MARIFKIAGIVVASLVGLLALTVVLLILFGEAWLRGTLERFASKQLEREVKIEKLDLHLLTWTPGMTLSGLKVGNPAWLASGTTVVSGSQMVDMGRFDVAVRLLPLLRGKVILSELGVENGDVNLLREVSGRANWTFGSTKTSSTTPLALPVIEHLYVKNSRLRLQDQLGKIAFVGGFETEEGVATEGGQPLKLSGRGQLNGQPFRLDLSGGSLASVLENQTYPFDLDVRHGRTRITAKGTFNQPLSFGDFKAALTLEGRNLADLYYLTGLALPITRDYSLKGDLSRAGDIYRLNSLNGKLGGSDLSGNLSVDIGGDKPKLVADLRSKLLDPADAGVIFGGSAESKYLLPDSELDVTRLRSMDADVKYKADAVNVDSLPLKQVNLTMKLVDGRLMLEPLAVTLPQGTVSGSLVIDASRDIPQLTADMRLSGGRLEDFVNKAGTGTAAEGALAGPIVARVKLAGAGKSIHAAAGAADGTAAVVVPNGEIRQAFAELMGVNAARGLGLFLSGDQTSTPIRCGVASFEGKAGTLYAQHLVVDTGVVLVQGGGSVNLKDESLNLTLKGDPKEARLLRLMVPVRIGGQLKDPSIGVNPVPLGVQAGAATALGAVLTPLAAVLPFVDIGLAEDANCAALLKDAREDSGVGVRR